MSSENGLVGATWLHTRVLKYLIMYGPRMLGCWEGDPPADVCGRLSGVSSSLWHENVTECENLIDRRVQSLAVFLELFTMAVVGYQLASGLVHYLWLRFIGSPHHCVYYTQQPYAVATPSQVPALTTK